MPRKPKTKKEPIKPSNIFQCQLCTDKPVFDQPSAFSAHIAEVHQMDPKAKYQKQLQLHMDTTDWYQSDYQWLNDGGVFAIQSVRNPRIDRGYW